MRKYIFICIAFCSVILFSGCSHKTDKIGNIVTFEIEKSIGEAISQDIIFTDDELALLLEEKGGKRHTVTQKGRIQESMPEFKFELTAYFNSQWGSYAVQSLNIYEDDRMIQTISIPELTLLGQTDISDTRQDTLGFTLEDVNFDGYQDIRLLDTLNGNYRVEWIYLVWNTEEYKFEHDTRLNEIANATFDQENKLISGTERASAACHYFSTYQYISGDIVKIRYEEDRLLYLTDEQIREYYDTASVKTDAESFEGYYKHVMERNEKTGELETVSEEYVFYSSPNEGKADEDDAALHVEVSSELGKRISLDRGYTP